MKKQKKSQSEKGELKPDGKLNPEDCFILTKEQEFAFRKAAFQEEQQRKKDFKIGGVMDFKLGEAGVSIWFVRNLFPSLG